MRVSKSPTWACEGQSRPPARALPGPVAGDEAGDEARRTRGGGWQRGQKYDERFMNRVRRIGVPQRAHGLPSWP